jgi:gluconate 2-dehydrogenase gamma chain
MEKGTKRQFRRRDMLKILGVVPGAALATSAPLSAAAQVLQEPSAVPAPAKAYQPKVFNPHQWNTVQVLCDLMIPADQHDDGAVEAGVPQFIDDWLNFKGGDLATQIKGGLTWLDLESNRLFQQNFADSTTTQQKELLDRIAYPEKAAASDASAVAFFNRLRDLVVSGYYTSRIGFKALPYLGNEPQSEWDGCPAPVLAKLGLERIPSKS